MKSELKNINIHNIQPHPKNPRILMREDVVAAIAAELKRAGHFSQEYALRVRPVDDFYQIVSGHHRHSAASLAGITEIPCWVRVMDDETAFMDLVRSNAQGELSPLEIGLHALEFVKLGKRGRGNSGDGLAEYATAISRTAARITQVRQAARVYKMLTQVNNLSDDQKNGLMTCSKHLTEIHQAPESLWPLLVQAMLSKSWSVKDTKAHVAKIAELIWRLAKEGKTQDATGKIMGWSLSKVKQYSALNGICQDAWKVVVTATEKAVTAESEDAVTKTVTDVTFTENLLRAILPLKPEQQLELAWQWWSSFPAAPCGWPAIPRRRLPRRRGFRAKLSPTGLMVSPKLQPLKNRQTGTISSLPFTTSGSSRPAFFPAWLPLPRTTPPKRRNYEKGL